MEQLRRFFRRNDLYHGHLPDMNRLVHRYPSTMILLSVSVATFLTIGANYLIQAVAWVMMYSDRLARFIFVLFYPAAIIAAGLTSITSFLRINLTGIDNLFQPTLSIFIKMLLAIIMGQATLKFLQPTVALIVIPLASNPLLLLTAVVFPFILVYLIYFFTFRVDLAIEALAAVNNNRTRTSSLVTRIQREGIVDTGMFDENMCVVCLTNPKIILIKPCNHFCVCSDCIERLEECPMCKTEIERHERIYPT